MKDSKEYSRELGKLYRRLKRKYPKVQPVIHNELVDALVHAIVSEDMSETEAQSAMKRFSEHFVDWNDLRVSRTEEIVEVLGADTPVTRGTASTLTRVLRAVFDKYNVVSLETLKKLGKRPARQTLEKIDGTSCFVVDYCVLTFLQGHAVPLTKKMIEYLRNSQLVHPDANEQEIEGFLTRQISANNAYEFYALLRHHSETHGSEPEKVKVRKTKVKTKTKK